MAKKTVQYWNLEGSNREIGVKLAQYHKNPAVGGKAPEFFTEEVRKEAMELYQKFCPGIVEELDAYAQTLKISVEDVAYSWMSYLYPRCSSLILGENLMEDKNTRIIRNYEFGMEEEDFTVCRTKLKDKYAHIGGTIAIFGRTEGINECGLAVSMSSCGFPVGNITGMRPPKVKGLQFWAVIRSLLENCKDVEEAVALVTRMPIAYNINLYLADKKGNGVLLETMNGMSKQEQISTGTEKRYLCGTNHIAISEFQCQENFAMRNSIVRLETLHRFMGSKNTIKEIELKEFFLKKYPDGMTTYYYKDYFGTIKTVILDPSKGTYQICWLGQEQNGWETFFTNQKIQERTVEKEWKEEAGTKEFFEIIPL